ncbi:MAG TPA: class IV adenylate cyclase [Gemmatimonadaceae bacterium]|jgi:predicted adenylyl cyclase CyaB|nr:class IV adenylate cyclase [Gemmatimonadaceae bacterium]
MLEVELKSVVDDVRLRRSAVEAAGGKLVYEGRLLDLRYDVPDRSLMMRDHVLRLRVYESANSRKVLLDWKGETRYEDGYKVREELSTPVDDPEVLRQIVERLGYVVTTEIDRQIAQYELDGVTVRFEEYPEMDALVEVEGEPEAIERVISLIGMPRTGFTSERLLDFMIRYEARTGRRAVLSRNEQQPSAFSHRPSA